MPKAARGIDDWAEDRRRDLERIGRWFQGTPEKPAVGKVSGTSTKPKQKFDDPNREARRRSINTASASRHRNKPKPSSRKY